MFKLIGANIQHVIRKIASGRTRLEILTDARTAPEREDIVQLPFVAERCFEVISDFSTAHFDSRFKGAAENYSVYECVCAVDSNFSVLRDVEITGISVELRFDCDLRGIREGLARQGDTNHRY